VTSGASPFSADGLFNATGAVFNPTFSYTFNDAGTFPYFCSPHYISNNMDGTVNVAAVQVEVLDPANVYVNTAYTGSEIGTENSPFKTIAAAIEAAVSAADPNPIIHVAPGTYTETFTEANTSSLASAMKLQVSGSGTVSIGATLPFSISGFHTRTIPLKITDNSKE